MSALYNRIEKKVNDAAKEFGITDSCRIREMICDGIRDEMVEEARTLTDTLNTMGNDIQEAVINGFLDGLKYSHRYLQGEFWGAMLKIIKKYGETEHFDARNEWAVNMCRRMAMAGEDPRTKELLEKFVENRRLGI